MLLVCPLLKILLCRGQGQCQGDLGKVTQSRQQSQITLKTNYLCFAQELLVGLDIIISSLQTIPILTLLQIHGAFFTLIAIPRMYTYVFACAYIFLNVICSVHMFLVCMFAGLNFWHWTTNSCIIKWSRLSLPCPALLGHLWFSV